MAYSPDNKISGKIGYHKDNCNFIYIFILIIYLYFFLEYVFDISLENGPDTPVEECPEG